MLDVTKNMTCFSIGQSKEEDALPLTDVVVIRMMGGIGHTTQDGSQVFHFEGKGHVRIMFVQLAF